uniref:Uncharacterized protein n=1 Tax=Paraclostridium sordellii TaxID=1505 RepID=A0A2I6SWD9_PARSO|nr:hypothetical protein [Paeniclostridium sordellii]AUO31840.1 hypothetical protein [Paeniclostridium sordellii]
MPTIKEIKVLKRLRKCIDIIDKVSVKLEWLLSNILCIFIAMNFSTETFNISKATIHISKTIEINVNTLLYVFFNLTLVYISSILYKWISKLVEEYSPKTPSEIISSILITLVTIDTQPINQDDLNFMIQTIVHRIFLMIITSIVILIMLVNVTIK